MNGTCQLSSLLFRRNLSRLFNRLNLQDWTKWWKYIRVFERLYSKWLTNVFRYPKKKFLLSENVHSLFGMRYDKGASDVVNTYACIACMWVSGQERGSREREEEEKGIDFSAGLCEMKPGRAIAINNDKNNPIRRLFDLSAPIFRARSLFWLITIFLDLGDESCEARYARARTRTPDRERAIAVRARSNLSNRARRTIYSR